MATNPQSPVTPIATTTPEDLGFDPERLERVREKIVADIDADRCHGVNLIVARHGEAVLNVTEGYADRAAGRELDPHSVFATMSVAKQFTNVLALSLVERGLLQAARTGGGAHSRDSPRSARKRSISTTCSRTRAA